MHFLTSEILFCQASCKEKQNTKMAEDPKSAIEDTPSNDYRNRLGSEVAIGIDDLSAIPKGTIDPVYEAKARVLNRAIQDIGMGWYQWQLFIVVGFGWASDVSMLFFSPLGRLCAIQARVPLLCSCSTLLKSV